MTVALVDDHVLGRVLCGAVPRSLRPAEALATTGCWYVRLCRAIDAGAGGRLSGPFSELSPQLRERAFAAVLQLPDDIRLVSLRDIGPSVGRIMNEHQLNLLSAEAVAAAEALGAEVHVSSEAPRLRAALTWRRIVLHVT